MTGKPVIFTAFPGYGVVTGHTAMSLYRLGATLAANGVGCDGSTLSYPDIEECRNVFLSIFYDLTDATHLLFVDADMRFPPELVLDMLVLDKPIVGCVYRKKDDKVAWVCATLDGAQHVESGFMPVDAVGMGVTLISRACVDAMVTHYKHMVFDIAHDDPCATFGPHRLTRMLRLFDKFPMGYAKLSEDYSFCKRWRDIGGEVYASVGHVIGHLGMKEYSDRLWDHLQSAVPSAEAA